LLGFWGSHTKNC